MNVIRIVIIITIVVVAFISGYFYHKLPKRELVYKLKDTLRLETNDKSKDYYLPAGTVLYLDWQPGEGGFDRYRIYINLFGPTPELKLSNKRGLIVPLTAYEK